MSQKIIKTLSEAIYSTVHRSKIEINEIADRIEKSPNLLYKWSYPPESDAHSPMQLKNLLPLIEATGNYSILDYLERMVGRIAIKIPRAAIAKGEETEMVNEYQKKCTTAVGALITFLNSPTKENHNMVESALEGVQKTTVSLSKYCEKKNAGQEELFFYD